VATAQPGAGGPVAASFDVDSKLSEAAHVVKKDAVVLPCEAEPGPSTAGTATAGRPGA